MFHLADYNLVNGVNDVLADMVAVQDESLTRRGGASGNGHYIFPFQMNILAAMHIGTSPTECKLVQPQWAAYSNLDLMALQTGPGVPSPVWLDDYREMPLMTQLNQELAIQESNLDGAGGHQVNTALWLAGPGWHRTLPTGTRVQMIFTATVTNLLGAWSVGTPITPPTVLNGGVYSVIGCRFVAASTLLCRLNFQTSPYYQGIKFKAGDICYPTFTAIPLQKGFNWMGEWGRFDTYYLPQIETLGTVAGAQTVTCIMDCVFLGPGASLQIA